MGGPSPPRWSRGRGVTGFTRANVRWAVANVCGPWITNPVFKAWFASQMANIRIWERYNTTVTFSVSTLGLFRVAATGAVTLVSA
jgi:hypothetical protein